MSDCSSNAMKPKEYLKTCRTCQAAASAEWYCTNKKDFVSPIKDRSNCQGYINCFETLEQRYQQLEQVARDMYQWIDGVFNHYWTVVPEQPERFRDQLKELGVIDD